MVLLWSWIFWKNGPTTQVPTFPGVAPFFSSLFPTPSVDNRTSGRPCLPTSWDRAGAGAGPLPAWLGLQDKAFLLVEPGGFHVLHIVVLDLAEDPDPLFSPLDFQWGRREGWEAEKSGSPL